MDLILAAMAHQMLKVVMELQMQESLCLQKEGMSLGHYLY